MPWRLVLDYEMSHSYGIYRVLSNRMLVGAIHADFEKKFIRAEVVNWKSLVDLGRYAGLREKGILRLEHKEYIVKVGMYW